VPEALIHGRVSVGGSEPLSATDVQLFYRELVDGLPRWMPRHDVRTNSAGEFRFAELPAGEYKLLTRERADDDPVADAPGRMYGYPPVFYPGAADFASAETIHISAGQTVEADLVAGLSDRFIHLHLSDNRWAPITPADEIKQQTPKLFDGYAKPDRILIRPEVWRRYCDGFDPAEIAGYFKQRGVLIAGDSSLSKAEQVIGDVGRYYVLAREALTGLTP